MLNTIAPTKRPFVPSPMQQGFMDWIVKGSGSAVLIAVAGSGKSTTIRRGLVGIPERDNVLILAFNSTIAKEMKEEVAALGAELGRSFSAVDARTFHSLGFGAVCRRLGMSPRQVQTDSKKVRNILKANVSPEEYSLYKSFVPPLVSLGKGQGVGALVENSEQVWYDIVEHHALTLDSEEASMERAIHLARACLAASNKAALQGHIDYDDQIYLPIKWKLSIPKRRWVFIDEAQDTNPVRRALARMALAPGGRLVAVGDPNQSIYGFTGATTDAIEQIKREFRAIELPLTVSYRCPRAAEPLVQPLVPHFSVHESAPEGEVLHLGPKGTMARLTANDAVLCRNTAPLVSMTFDLIAAGRGCVVLGKDIGAGLVAMVEQMNARGIDNLLEKLDAYAQRECAALEAKGHEEKAEGLLDRVACIRTVAERMPEGRGRTVPALIDQLEELFADNGGRGLLTLCTAHKAKGKEWPQVAILEPELMPSKWARTEWQYEQEINLQYVAWTRFKQALIFMDGTDEEEEETA